MTMIANKFYKCGLCGDRVVSIGVTSTNAFGSPDLDLRPPQMERSTMKFWLCKCLRCGYIRSDIETDGKQHREYVNSEEYITCEGTNLSNELACDFYKAALILLREGDKMGAYKLFLCAAWALDDANDEKGAILCRNKAIFLYNEQFAQRGELVLRHIDLLRRARRFDEAIDLCEFFASDDEIMQKVTEFQMELSKNKDASCYRISDCMTILMKLYDEPFDLVKCGKKTIEVRCNDEKRKKIKVGDRIIFYRYSNPDDKIFAEVTNLKNFNSFEELYSSYPISLFGHEDKTVEDMLSKVDQIYSQEEQKKYGALAISVKVNSTANLL